MVTAYTLETSQEAVLIEQDFVLRQSLPLSTADKMRAEGACTLCRVAKKEDRRSKGGLEGMSICKQLNSFAFCSPPSKGITKKKTVTYER